MIVLGIETSCDDTSFSLVENGSKILALKTASQEKIHQKFGGVFPEMAAREHEKAFIPLLDACLKEAQMTLNDIDLIAVTQGPGLIGSLLVGVEGAKTLAFSLKKPLVSVQHVEAHLFAATMSSNTSINWPALGIVISGGHTVIYRMDQPYSYQKVSETVDDAIGEAFDKCAKMLHLPYPGGPAIEKLAANGNPNAYPLKAGYVKQKPLYFSFSGLKTAVKYLIEDLGGIDQLTQQQKQNIAASFQQAAFSDLINKILKISEKEACHTFIFGGGVTMNRTLRTFAESQLKGSLLFPSALLCQDNAAMIAGLGFYKFFELKQEASLDLKADPRLLFAT